MIAFRRFFTKGLAYLEHPRPLLLVAPAKSMPSSPPMDAAELYRSAIRDHPLLTKTEELTLARRLEEAEVAIWKILLAGPLAAKAQTLLRELDPPVKTASPRKARTADPDRLVASRVLATTSPEPALRALLVEADRIRERFVTCNLRLVPSTIRRHGYHLTSSLSMSDLIQEGNFGLLRAISRFDYRRGLRFSTFATWWIRHYLVRARQNLGSEVRVPVHLQDLVAKVRQAKKALRKKLSREPSQSELAAAIKVSPKTLESLDRDWPRYREALPSFDSVGGGDDGETPSYLTSDAAIADEIVNRHQEDDQLAAAVERIPPQLAQIVARRFGLGGLEPETLFQIAESMKLSRERIRQLEKKAIGLMRHVLDEGISPRERRV